ncbi:MAG: hypothetical protein JXQ29_12535, partial [Planctomycetes bacterium]|nr:hypothetical protein [Planctomycetota bacterium]
MSRVVLVAVLAMVLLGLAPLAAAQLHGSGWVYGGVPAPLSPASYGVLGHIDLTGAMKLWVDPAAYPKVFDGSTTVEGGTMGPGNTYHLVAIASTKLHQSFLIVDLSGKIVNTLVVTPVPPDKGGGWVVDVAIDPSGDYIVLEAPPTGIKGGALYRFNPTTFSLVTLHAGAPFSSPTAVTVDVDTGDAIVLNSPYLYRIAPSGSSLSTIGRFGVPVLGQVTQDIR